MDIPGHQTGPINPLIDPIKWDDYIHVICIRFHFWQNGPITWLTRLTSGPIKRNTL